MNEYDGLAAQVVAAGAEIHWYGSADDAQIEALQERLLCPLPSSYKRFLRQYGGGGVVGDDVCGIEDNDATKTSGGTALGGTLSCRSRFGLPFHLVAVYLHDDEVCWCLDTRQTVRDECPVVSYSLALRKVDGVVAPDFAEFMRRHLEAHGGGA